MRTLYIVTGSTGEYSDYQDWFVRGFFDHEKAVALRDQLEAKARELGLDEELGRNLMILDYEARQAALPALVAVDPEAQCDYTGVTYFIQECPVDDEAGAR